MIEFSDNIHRQSDFGNYVISIFIDYTKAFHIVDNDILLQKLARYGVGSGTCQSLYKIIFV